jgi:hypothetical protein
VDDGVSLVTSHMLPTPSNLDDFDGTQNRTSHHTRTVIHVSIGAGEMWRYVGESAGLLVRQLNPKSLYCSDWCSFYEASPLLARSSVDHIHGLSECLSITRATSAQQNGLVWLCRPWCPASELTSFSVFEAYSKCSHKVPWGINAFSFVMFLSSGPACLLE